MYYNINPYVWKVIIDMKDNKPQTAGRPRSIDREKLLDIAETIVAQHGVAGLTMDALARAANITKGGVQYCFGNKEGLIKAMIMRWSDHFDAEVAQAAGGNTDALAHVRAHIKVTREADVQDESRFAAMLAGLIPNSDQLADTRAWYARQLQGLDFSTEQGRNARLAFIANEGAFLLRSFNFFDLSPQEWQAVFGDIERLLEPPD
ncbi:TetR family transcriptional regulator [Advenella incenata]|uniref:TetR family transcriptional regulator n=2 Tax=Advenella incenata TaxID=267800 RepID=A0A4Q7VAT3_9BURK|nr:TetR family transcriptional regulator [Advenella incenata]